MTNYSGSDVISSFAYTYYADGSQRTKTDHENTVTTYTYNGLGRLTVESVSGGSTLTYAYDRNGNRASLRATGSEYYTVLYDYDAANRLLSETRSGSGTLSSTLYTYDANGNMLTVRQSSAGLFARVEWNQYNGFNQLISQSVSSDGVTTNLAFGYYPDGIRSVKLVNSTPIYYAVNNGYVSAEYYGDDLTAVYLWGANLIKSEIGSDTNYYLYNTHGDVIQLADENGNVVYAYVYDAFGVEDESDSHNTNPFRYCGEYFDRESGKYYLRARYYDPKLGRFTQIDAMNDGFNLYVYCHNSPMIFYDPSGLTAIPLRRTIEELGCQVEWDPVTKIATVHLDGQTVEVYNNDSHGSYNMAGIIYTDDVWLFAALGISFDLGSGWQGRIERGNSGKNYERHVHIYKDGKCWSQNEDGSPHDDGNSASGAPPKKVLQKLKEVKNWDWKKKEEDWLNKIETYFGPDGYMYIQYPDGKKITTYNPYGIPLSRQELKNYYLYQSYTIKYSNSTLVYPIFLPFTQTLPSVLPIAPVYFPMPSLIP